MTELWNLRIGLAFQSVRDLKKMLLLHRLVFKNGLFTVGALNNLDHNHCSIISLFQSPTKVNPYKNRPPVTMPPLGASQHSLPDNYALLPAGALHDSNRYEFLYQLK